MYSRNYIYLSDKEQEIISDFRIVIAGCGLGSVIAECAIRLGFMNIVLIDGDKVELSNLNRQQYTQADIGKFKAEALSQRLLSINPSARIRYYNEFLTSDNISKYVYGCDVVINTIDFDSSAPFVLDEYCVKHNIVSIHPYNLGWAGCVFVVNKESEKLKWVSSKSEGFELKVVSHFIRQQEEKGIDCTWLLEHLNQYHEYIGIKSPPQLSVASYIVAGMCCDILSQLAMHKPVKLFPELYFSKS